MSSGTVHRLDLLKPDGRRLWLYGRRPLWVDGEVPSPDRTPVEANPHLRWHPLRGEWVIYAAHRQNRTFLPPADYNPLAPTRDPDNPTELPQGEYDVAVFENRFPSLVPGAGPTEVPGAVTRPGIGACEVVVFTQNPDLSLAALEASHVGLLLDVWADRTTELGARPEIRSVLPFENRGVEVGVTLHHPHGQIYAYDHVPPVQARALEHARAFLHEHGEAFGPHLARTELELQLRVVASDEHAVAVVPPFARYAYEVWVLPRRGVAFLSELTRAERASMASLLQGTLRRYDRLWDRPMPYLLTVHQAPTDGEAHPEWPLRFEIYPALRAPGKLKFLAGTELGAGVFANDALPEEKAAELRAVQL